MSAARQLPNSPKQHDDHEHRALEQVGLHGVDGAVNKLGAVVLDLDFHALGQFGLNLSDARLDPFGHLAAVLAGEHHRRANDRLVAVERGRPGAEFGPGLYFGHVFDEERRDAGAKFERQIGNVLRIVHATHGADGELFTATADDAAAGILNVLRDNVGQFTERHAHIGQRIGFGLHDELLFVAAALVDVRDARHSAEQRLDDVFLDFAQLDQLLQFGRRFILCVGPIIDAVVEDFSQARADGREFGKRARRQLFQHTLQTLGNKLACPVDVCAILKLDRHLREAEFRQRAHFFHAGQASERNFDGLRDEFFRFFGGERRDFGVHLHLRSRNVGHRINGQMECRPETSCQQDDGSQQDKSRLAQRKFENSIDHDVSALGFRGFTKGFFFALAVGTNRVDVQPGEQFQLLSGVERLALRVQ